MSFSPMPCLTLFAAGMDDLSDPVRLEDFGAPVGPHHWEAGMCGPWPVLRTQTSDVPVCLCGACSSSLDVARRLAAEHALPVWGSVLALVQRNGRGQLGRMWHSPPGNLFAALRLPRVPPFDSPAAAPALSAFLAMILRDLGYPVSVKWPNDLVLTEPAPCKVGGILLEERDACLIAGIGLNICHAPPASVLREGYALPGGSLRRPDAPVDLLTLWRQLVTGIKLWYEQSPQEHVASSTPLWLQAAERCLLWQGQPVRLIDGHDERDTVRGTVAGLAPDGGLRLRVDGRIEIFHSGGMVPDIPQPLFRTPPSSLSY